MSVRLRSDEGDGQYINFQISDNFTSTNNLIVKIENGNYIVKTSSSNTYSTNEKKIGTWIDGKSIYRKVIDFGALPNATTKFVPHNISDLDYVISLQAIAKLGTSFLSLPRVHSDNNLSIGFEIYGDDLLVLTSYDFSSATAHIIIEYTKKTEVNYDN